MESKAICSFCHRNTDDNIEIDIAESTYLICPECTKVFIRVFNLFTFVDVPIIDMQEEKFTIYCKGEETTFVLPDENMRIIVDSEKPDEVMPRILAGQWLKFCKYLRRNCK